MSSPFLHLNRKKLTLKQDADKYQQASSTMYKKEAWRFFYLLLLCKLYDMSNLPILKSRKLYIYTSFVMITSSISFYRSSQPVTEMLVNLDQKYKQQYQKHIKQINFEGVI